MKKIYSFLLVLLMAVMSVGTAQAWTIVHEGGDGWYIAQYDDGRYVLAIWKSSVMKDYASSSATPWYQFREYINDISIADQFSGTPNVGTYCFADLPNLITASLYSGYQHDSYVIRAHAFEGCAKLKTVSMFKATSIGDYAFKGCKELGDQIFGLGDNVTYIGAHAFENCTKLCGIYGSDWNQSYTVGDYAFSGCTNFRWINGENMTSVGAYAFANCPMTTITLTKCQTVGERAFNKNQLSYVRFGGAITNIGSKAFYDGLEDNGTFVMTRSTPPTTASDAFSYNNLNTITLDCPSGNAYNVAPWSSFKKKTLDPELYAIISGTTMNVYYDNLYISSGGARWYDFNHMWDLTTSQMNSVTKVVIDPSVAAAHLTSTRLMFGNYFTSLTTIEGLEYLDTRDVTEMNSMFRACQKLQAVDVRRFHTSNCTSMNGMFSGCKALTELNLNSFDMSNVTDAGFMFEGCINLQRIYCEKDWTNVSMSYAFFSCTSLVGGWGTSFDENYKNAQYARPDGGEDAPGYFWRISDTGEAPVELNTEGIEEVSQEPTANSQKLIKDGQILIIRDGKTFNALGVEIK